MDGFWVNGFLALWEVAGILLPYRIKEKGEGRMGSETIFWKQDSPVLGVMFVGSYIKAV
jgi:hypothetical protein